MDPCKLCGEPVKGSPANAWYWHGQDIYHVKCMWNEIERLRQVVGDLTGNKPFEVPQEKVARLYNNGAEVRVDMNNTGENYPNCTGEQRGFPWLSFGVATWEHAGRFARDHGATRIVREG